MAMSDAARWRVAWRARVDIGSLVSFAGESRYLYIGGAGPVLQAPSPRALGPPRRLKRAWGVADSGYTIARLCIAVAIVPSRASRAGGTAKRPERKHHVGTTLITGGSGYIGSLLARELQENDHDVRVLDSLLHGQEDIAAEQEQAGIEVVRGDIRDA